MNTINNTEIGDDSDLDSEIDCDSDAGDTVEANVEDIEAGSDDDGVVTVEDSVGLYDDTTTNITVADINDGSTNDAIMGVEFDGSRGVDEIDGSRGVDEIDGSRGVDEIDGSRGVDEIDGSRGVDEIDGSRGVDDSGTDVELETQRSIEACEAQVGEIEVREIDQIEQSEVDEFFEKGCGCTLFGGKPCFTAFTREHICSIRDQCSSLDRHDRYNILFGHVMATIRASSTVQSRGHQTKDRSRVSGDYLHEGMRVR